MFLDSFKKKVQYYGKSFQQKTKQIFGFLEFKFFASYFSVFANYVFCFAAFYYFYENFEMKTLLCIRNMLI